VRIALAAVGFTSIIGQVIFMRELVAVFYGNELVFGLILAAWLLWVAAGSWGAGRWIASRQEERFAFTIGLLLSVPTLPAQIALTRVLRTLLNVTPGAFVGFGGTVWGIVLTLGPLCLLLGALFTLGTRLLTVSGEQVGSAYVYESAGAVIGGILFSFLAIRVLDPFQAALGVGAVNLTVAIWVMGTSKWPGLRGLILVLGIGLLAVVPAWRWGARLHLITMGWQWPRLIFTHDSPYGRLVITGEASQRVFFENGLLMFETQGTYPEEVAHFPLLEHPAPRQVLLIGGGVAGDLREILKHPVSSVDYVELDPLLIAAARQYLPPEDAAYLADPRVHLALRDGRLYAREHGGPFDIVIVDLPEPSTGQLNRLYTLEFFQEVRSVLAPGGILSISLPSAENYWSPELARRNASVYHTLRAVFPHVLVLPGETNFFLASETPLSDDPALLIGRLRERGIQTRWVNESYLEYLFTTDRYAQVRQQLQSESQVRLNRDLTPICYYYDLVLWLSVIGSKLRNLFEAATVLRLGWLVPPLVLLTLFTRRRLAALPTVIALAGFADMVLELVVLFGFQVLHGYVYHEVTLVVTAFMAGLALGGAGANQMVTRFQSADENQKVMAVLRGAQATLVAYSLLLPILIELQLPFPQLAFPILALLIGVPVGAEYPLAAALSRGPAGQVAGRLYAADLVGGCAGALLGGLLLVPLLGIPQTCLAVALFSLAGLAVLA